MDNNKKFKITVIDDDKEFTETIKEFLESRGFSVACAYGGRAGMDIIKKYQPDIVILDIGMPDMDGRDVLVKLKKDNGTKNIPVIILTGRGDEQYDRSYGIELGAEEYISKPYDSAILLRQVNNILSKKK